MAKRTRTIGSDSLDKPLRSAPLSQTHPHLAQEWRHTGPDGPDKVTAGSGRAVNWKHGSKKIIWWQCRKAADHVYEKSVYDRCVRGLGCPFCLNRKASASNSLGSLYPELKKYFDEEENGCSANEVRASDQTPYWWSCDCGTSYKRSPYHMVGMGAGCKHCRQQKRESDRKYSSLPGCDLISNI